MTKRNPSGNQVVKAVVLICALVLAVPAGGAVPRDVSAYQGLGTWVDIWDGTVLAQPEAAVARMRDLGVTTLYLETSNYSQRVDLVRPAALGRFVDAAKANGLRVVAWYLPSFQNLAFDLRRSLAALRFRSPGGYGFDSFALDIEASVVKPASRRTARLLALSARLRAAVGSRYPLGAIIPSPRGMELKPAYWPRFPYAGLARYYDVFLPMGYFTFRYKTAAAARDYTLANVALIREGVGDEGVAVHAVGGLAAGATLAQVRAFAAAAAEEGALGASLYDYASTPAATWRVLSAAA
jgi:hypothetical protein